MGAETFSQVATGTSPDQAFRSAVAQAQYDYGHAGYTGTIAEKGSFVMLTPSTERLAEIKANRWFDYDPDDPLWEKVDDKWGPAGCIDLGESRYLFFGWASS